MPTPAKLSSEPEAAAITPKRMTLTPTLPARIAHGAHRGSRPFVRRRGAAAGVAGALGGASVIVMSVGSREFLAAADDPARDRVDGERDDEQDEAGRDQDVDVGAVGLGEREGDVGGDRAR